MKKKFTLEDIQEFLEEISIKWIDKMVFDTHTNKYRRAMLKDFNPLITHLYLQTENGRKATVVAYISNDEFILKFSNAQVNMTKQWIERLNEKLSNKEI